MPKRGVLILLTLVTILATNVTGTTRASDSASEYAMARIPTPVLNIPHFAEVFGGPDGKTLHLDSQGLIRELETVALPGTVFRVLDRFAEKGGLVLHVTTAEYPYPTADGYYIDSRFVTLTDRRPPERAVQLPARGTIIERIRVSVGLPYSWGGTVGNGIPEMLEYFPPAGPISDDTRDRWSLKGVDCSGLLYGVTDGYTPRNTSALLSFGKPVEVAGRTLEEIAAMLRPLDLLVWNGHMCIVLDQGELAQSRLSFWRGHNGVVTAPLREGLGEIMAARIPADEPETTAPEKKTFVVRRWYPGD